MTDGCSKRNCLDVSGGQSRARRGHYDSRSFSLLAEGMSFHEYVKLEMQITMNVKCGCLDSARGIYDTMGVRDVFSWTSMVNGYAKAVS